MRGLLQVIIDTGLLFYILSSIFYFLLLKTRKNWVNKTGFVFAIIGFIFNIILFVQLLYTGAGLNFSVLHMLLNLIVIFIILIFIIIQTKYRFYISGAVIMPLVILIILVSIFVPENIREIPAVLISFWFPVHVIVTLLSYSAFIVAFCVGLGFLIHEHQLKAHHLSKFYFDLPSLEKLDELNYSLITSGIVFLSIGIVTGSLWAKDAWGTYWIWEPKLVFSLITWLIYILTLHVRIFYGWRGKRTAYLAIIGFTLTIFTFIGCEIFMRGLHSFI